MALSDTVALAISGVGTAGIIWFVLATVLFLKEEKKDHWFFIPVLAAGGTSWLMVEKIIKPLIARPRPTFEMGAIILGNNLPDYSFPSGHATIAWALATVLAHKEPKWKTFFFILAFLISFSRMYIGKHYPLDVIGGGLLGWGIGRLSIDKTAKYLSRLFK
ncbi:phosphatase PAP2 family protein [Candidatus Gottesmanbacteria bacterium]|nr:phosphatase PAP2 family protein [Candidatus Gottesmanbacteria bacterium]